MLTEEMQHRLGTYKNSAVEEKESTRRQLEQQVQEFMARGNRPSEIPLGVSAYGPKSRVPRDYQINR